MAEQQRYCSYGVDGGGHFVDPGPGWGVRRDRRHGTRRLICPTCRAVRKLPKDVLERMVNENRAARAAAARAVQQKSEEERNKP